MKAFVLREPASQGKAVLLLLLPILRPEKLQRNGQHHSGEQASGAHQITTSHMFK